MDLLNGRLNRTDYLFGIMTSLLWLVLVVVILLLISLFVFINFFDESVVVQLITFGELNQAESIGVFSLFFVTFVLVIISSLLALIFQIGLSARRLQDLNISGYWALFILVGLLSYKILIPLLVVVYVALSLIKGNDGDNDYGPPICTNNFCRLMFGEKN